MRISDEPCANSALDSRLSTLDCTRPCFLFQHRCLSLRERLAFRSPPSYPAACSLARSPVFRPRRIARLANTTTGDTRAGCRLWPSGGPPDVQCTTEVPMPRPPTAGLPAATSWCARPPPRGKCRRTDRWRLQSPPAATAIAVRAPPQPRSYRGSNPVMSSPFFVDRQHLIPIQHEAGFGSS